METASIYALLFVIWSGDISQCQFNRRLYQPWLSFLNFVPWLLKPQSFKFAMVEVTMLVSEIRKYGKKALR